MIGITRGICVFIDFFKHQTLWNTPGSFPPFFEIECIPQKIIYEIGVSMSAQKFYSIKDISIIE